MGVSDLLGEVKRLAQVADRRKAAYAEALESRDNAIRSAIRDGVTMYRIAQVTGLTETAVRKVRDR